MALEMRERCEKCGGGLPLAAEAFVCSEECTFCPACASGLASTCPSCGGELVRRPRRATATLTPRAVVRRLHETWNTGDLAAVDAIYAEDFVGHFPPSSHLPDRRGREGAREGIRRAKAAFPDWHEAVEAMVTEGNTVVTRYTSTGTHLGEFRGLPGVTEVAATDHVLRMRVSGAITPVVQAAAKYELLDFVSREPSLEETFLAQYGQSAVEVGTDER